MAEEEEACCSDGRVWPVPRQLNHYAPCTPLDGAVAVGVQFPPSQEDPPMEALTGTFTYLATTGWLKKSGSIM